LQITPAQFIFRVLRSVSLENWLCEAILPAKENRRSIWFETGSRGLRDLLLYSRKLAFIALSAQWSYRQASRDRGQPLVPLCVRVISTIVPAAVLVVVQRPGVMGFIAQLSWKRTSHKLVVLH
jgi:hypothetical protein